MCKMFFNRVFEAPFLTETKTIDFIIKVSYVSIALISSYLFLNLICCSAEKCNPMAKPNKLTA